MAERAELRPHRLLRSVPLQGNNMFLRPRSSTSTYRKRPKYRQPSPRPTEAILRLRPHRNLPRSTRPASWVLMAQRPRILRRLNRRALRTHQRPQPVHTRRQAHRRSRTSRSPVRNRRRPSRLRKHRPPSTNPRVRTSKHAESRAPLGINRRGRDCSSLLLRGGQNVNPEYRAGANWCRPGGPLYLGFAAGQCAYSRCKIRTRNFCEFSLRYARTAHSDCRFGPTGCPC
jgi:hypothetical protein